MKMSEKFEPQMRGEFKVTGKNKNGDIVYEYEDNNVVVDDARPVTAYLLSQAVASGNQRPEFDNDGIFLKDDFEYNQINPDNFKINFMKVGGGFPRKRSFCDSSSLERPLVPNELDTDVRSSLFNNLDYVSTLTASAPSGWRIYGEATNQQPYNTSSLLYPRKSDTDLVDRDYQWSKRILRYTFPFPVESQTLSFRATFETTMRFDEGNGPHYDCLGNFLETENDRNYEYREAGLFIGAQPWGWSDNQSAAINEEESSLTPHPGRVVTDAFGKRNAVGALDSTLSNNLREYRHWDGYSNLISNWGADTDSWPTASSSVLTWASTLGFRGDFKSVYQHPSTLAIDSSNLSFQGRLYQGHYMVARKTFPAITKTSDIEFTIQWSLVFG